MDHIGGSSSSSDDDSGPQVIVPPPPHRRVLPDGGVVELLSIEDYVHVPRIGDNHRSNNRSASGNVALIDLTNTEDILAERDIINDEEILNRVRASRPNHGLMNIMNNHTQNLMDNIQHERHLQRCLENSRRNMQAHINNMNVEDVIEIFDDDDDDDDDDNDAAAAAVVTGTGVASGICDPDRVRNYKDIFKYATDLSDGMPMSINQEIDARSFTEERKKFLTNVLSTMSVNVHEEMNNSINILFDNNKQVEEHEFAFDVIAEYVDNIDYANDFEKLGGFHIFLPCIRSEHPSVRVKTCELISTLVQNNPYCQEKFMENTNYLKALISMVENDNDDEVRVKALAAISSLVRQNIPVFWQFIELGGKDLILNSLKSPIDKLKIKAVFIICSTCHMGNDVAELYVDNGVVEIISSIIMGMEKNVESFHHELFLSTLNQLIRLSPVRVKEICSSVEDFKQALTSLRDSYSNESKYQDEKDQILWLMETLTL
ncbi:uncharacterized protein LOC132924671 [Rhopalosiphum padi]|uniref:uncharacterized protein LOC132924671 n=1 Tax=Rhopalosiphum padi TaxID=40932 RepID=UPI00298D7917|nr:uncharacterized protein LOC132924671 [Rhopalosiphum padi]